MPGLLPSLSCFLDDFNSCAASIASCFKVKSLSTFMDTVTIYFFSCKSCLVGRFEFLFLFRFEFCLRTGEAYSSFLNCFLFLFFRSLVFARSALFYKSLLYFNCFVCYCSVYCFFRHGGENALLLYVENANAPIDTSLSEDKINKICLWFDNVPLTSLAIIIIMLSYSGVVW